MSVDCLILGAGVSGLAAGIRCALFGQSVMIVERHHRVGGLNSYYNRLKTEFDVGLHAMTNYVPKGTKGTPFMRLLRQLRLRYDDFNLVPQLRSTIMFNDETISFANAGEGLASGVGKAFPSQAKGFAELSEYIASISEEELFKESGSMAREVLSKYLTDQRLIDMILCPLLYYGSATEHDMDFGQFVIMWRAIFVEGFSRPKNGVRPMLDMLVEKFVSLGGELRLSCGVKQLHHNASSITKVEFDDGSTISPRAIMSSAGVEETRRLCSEVPRKNAHGKLSFVEAVFILDKSPELCGVKDSIVFFNRSDKLKYRRPNELYDTASGVICCPDMFAFDEPLGANVVRVTVQANYDLWEGLSKADYATTKEQCRESILDLCDDLGFSIRDSIKQYDMFTPCTIKRYTGHLAGAVYGSENKVKDGTTKWDNLFLCGTDQGFLGITGASLSGVFMANKHLAI